MGRLRQLGPRVRSVAPRVRGVGDGADRLARREKIQPGRRFYHTARWRKLRWQVLVEARFTCARCGWFGGGAPSQLVGDHIRPHQGDEGLFFDRANIQCLCKTCHDGAKQSAERAGPDQDL